MRLPTVHCWPPRARHLVWRRLLLTPFVCLPVAYLCKAIAFNYPLSEGLRRTQRTPHGRCAPSLVALLTLCTVGGTLAQVRGCAATWPTRAATCSSRTGRSGRRWVHLPRSPAISREPRPHVSWSCAPRSVCGGPQVQLLTFSRDLPRSPAISLRSPPDLTTALLCTVCGGTGAAAHLLSGAALAAHRLHRARLLQGPHTVHSHHRRLACSFARCNCGLCAPCVAQVSFFWVILLSTISGRDDAALDAAEADAPPPRPPKKL